MEIVGCEQLREQYGIDDPRLVIDILALWGDAADNIPGVPGIGGEECREAGKRIRHGGKHPGAYRCPQGETEGKHPGRSGTTAAFQAARHNRNGRTHRICPGRTRYGRPRLRRVAGCLQGAGFRDVPARDGGDAYHAFHQGSERDGSLQRPDERGRNGLRAAGYRPPRTARPVRQSGGHGGLSFPIRTGDGPPRKSLGRLPYGIRHAARIPYRHHAAATGRPGGPAGNGKGVLLRRGDFRFRLPHQPHRWHFVQRLGGRSLLRSHIGRRPGRFPRHAQAASRRTFNSQNRAEHQVRHHGARRGGHPGSRLQVRHHDTPLPARPGVSPRYEPPGPFLPQLFAH